MNVNETQKSCEMMLKYLHTHTDIHTHTYTHTHTHTHTHIQTHTYTPTHTHTHTHKRLKSQSPLGAWSLSELGTFIFFNSKKIIFAIFIKLI